MFKRTLKTVAEALFDIEARVASAWASSAHRRLMTAQWSMPPYPQNFDHRIDLYYQWLKSRDPMWVERGVLSGIALKGGDVLELSCGDGFNSRNFYSIRARRVVACDVDRAAIERAQSANAAPNVEYQVTDIRSDMPQGTFDNVVWDFGFPLSKHFSMNDVAAICNQVKQRLAGSGIFSGYTIADTSNQVGDLCFARPDDLRRFLSRHFKHLTVFQTNTPGRTNLYFWASDGDVPMRDGWNEMSIT
jgi:SAM-dependent methyltransferase